MLIGIMSNQNHEVDELDYILRDALRIDRSAASNAKYIFAALHARIVAERWPARTVLSSPTPSWSGCHMPASYWYLAPLIRVVR
jgi:hypothetical protein